MARTVPMAIAPMRPSDLSITANGIEIGKIESWKPAAERISMSSVTGKRKFRFIAKEDQNEDVHIR